jgi:SagB-type dehydrogenase family enzyme
MDAFVTSDRMPADIRGYHLRTRHAPQRYALGPAFLDWTSQPSPYRRFEGAPLIDLPFAPDPGTPFPGPAAQPEPIDRNALGLFFELAFGLSAWKSVDGSTWAVRNNPSSGNLHPTEAYALLNAVHGMNSAAALYHYAPLEHGLERRAQFTVATVLPPDGFLLALSSVPWREAWKYGERAFRYCQLDAGHAIGAAAQAAAALGWRAHLLSAPSDDEIVALIGLDRAEASHRREEEHPDMLLWISADSAQITAPEIDFAGLQSGEKNWSGAANRLSEDHDGWPLVDIAVRLCRKTSTAPLRPVTPAPSLPLGDSSIADVVRRRRSVQRMDGKAVMSFDDFGRMLAMTLSNAGPLLSAFPFPPRIALAVFVHRIEGLEAGLYLFDRGEEVSRRLRDAISPVADWPGVEIAGGRLFRLRGGACESEATRFSCLQPIAGKGCFAVSMIADFDRTLAEEGAFAYRRLHWEAGLIGHSLYLSATALGLSGTGIGCFFDDEAPQLIGLASGQTQFLPVYHFTVGRAVEDARILTLPPYAARQAPAG